MNPFSPLIQFVENNISLDQRYSHELIDRLRPVTKLYRKGEYLCQSNDYPLSLGFVTSGLFRVYIETAEGGIYVKKFVGESEFVGPYSSIIQDLPANVSCQALVDSNVILVSPKRVRGLIELQPQFQKLGRLIAEQSFCEREAKEFSQLTESATQRYERFSKRYQQYEDIIPLQDVAYYLGISPVSLSRIRKKSKKLT